jgi:hypothetical protein
MPGSLRQTPASEATRWCQNVIDTQPERLGFQSAITDTSSIATT